MDYTKASLKNIKANAKALGVEVKPSSRKNKKFDVYDKDGKYITSIGDSRYKDYHLYKQKNKEKAEERRRLYKIRHDKHRHEKNTASYYADKILWN